MVDLPRSQARLGKAVVAALDGFDIDLAAYVADHMLDGIVEEFTLGGQRRLLTSTREDEALAVLAGAYLGGQRGVMFMQSSGFALCANALGSVLLSYQIPIPMIVGLRGQLGEFNVAQVIGGDLVEATCRAMGLLYIEPRSHEELERDLPLALTTCFGTERPVCVGIGRSLLP